MVISRKHTESILLKCLINDNEKHTEQELAITNSTLTAQSEVRRSTKHIVKPQWLKDYTTQILVKEVTLGLAIDTMSFPSLNFFTDSPSLNHEYINFLAALSTITEPKSYFEARNDSNWIHAMQTELDTLESNNIWILIELPVRKKSYCI